MHVSRKSAAVNEGTASGGTASGQRRPMPTRRSWLGLVAAAVLLAVVVPLAIFLISDDAGTANVVSWTLPVVRMLVHLTSIVAIALLSVGVFLPTRADDPEQLTSQAQRLGRQGSAAALAAVVACVVLLFWTYFDVLGTGPFQGGGLDEFGTFLNQLASGRALLAQAGMLVLSAVLARVARTIIPLRMALFLVVAGGTTMGLGGHSASASGHGLAMFSMTGHIAAASLWVGGLAGLGWLAWRNVELLQPAAARFSRIALICAAAVGVTGVVSAVVRVEQLETLPGSLYGAVLLLKVLVFAGLIGFGVLHRRRLLNRESFTPRAFAQLAAGELLIMAVAYGLAVALVRLDPPVAALAALAF